MLFKTTFINKYVYICDTSGSQSIAARVKELRRPAKKKQKQPQPAVTALDSPGSTQHK